MLIVHIHGVMICIVIYNDPPVLLDPSSGHKFRESTSGRCGRLAEDLMLTVNIPPSDNSCYMTGFVALPHEHRVCHTQHLLMITKDFVINDWQPLYTALKYHSCSLNSDMFTWNYDLHYTGCYCCSFICVWMACIVFIKGAVWSFIVSKHSYV